MADRMFYKNVCLVHIQTSFSSFVLKLDMEKNENNRRVQKGENN